MKKFISLAALVLCVVFVMCTAGCKSKDDDNSSSAVDSYKGINMTVGCLKNASSMGFASLMDKSSAGKTANFYKFNLYDTEQEIVAALKDGTIDIATLSLDTAGASYNNGEDIILIATDTAGGLWMVENGDTVNKIEDVADKKIGIVGRNSSTEHTVRFLLRMTKVDVAGEIPFNYYETQQELTDALNSGAIQLAVMWEPAASDAILQNPELKRKINLSDEWRVQRNMELPVGCMVTRATFSQLHPAAIEKFLDEISDSVKFAASKVGKNAELCAKYGITDNAEALEVISNSSLSIMKGDYMYKTTVGYYSMLFSFDRTVMGGKQPNTGFYFK